MLYDDGVISCDETRVIVRWYYPWGAKSIPYASISAVKVVPLTLWRGRWRIWGSGDLRHWFNLDRRRPQKNAALVLRTGRWVRPVITPDDPGAVEAILRERGVVAR